MQVEIKLKFKNTLIKIIDQISFGDNVFALYEDLGYTFDLDRSHVKLTPVGDRLLLADGDLSVTYNTNTVSNIPLNQIPNLPLFKHAERVELTWENDNFIFPKLMDGVITEIDTLGISLIRNNIHYRLVYSEDKNDITEHISAFKKYIGCSFNGCPIIEYVNRNVCYISIYQEHLPMNEMIEKLFA